MDERDRFGRERLAVVDPTESRSVRDFIYTTLQLDEVSACASRANGWKNPARAQAEDHYRDFLWVCWNYWKAYGKGFPVIVISADEMLHCHIDTGRRFLDDCAHVFGPGRRLEHYPVVDGKAVLPSDELAATRAYAEFLPGKELPTDLRSRCVWAVVE